MAENKDLELINVYQAPPLDRQYSEREFAVRWYGVMKDAELNLPAEAGPVPTPEAVAAAPTGAEPTSAATPAETPPAGQPSPTVTPLPLTLADTLSRLVGKPLPLNAAADAAFTAAAETAKHLLMGAKQTVLPEETPKGAEERARGTGVVGQVAGQVADRAQGVYEFLVEGLMGALSIPFSAISAGLRQQIENQNPAALQTEILSGGAAATVRTATGQGNPLQPLPPNATPEQIQRQAKLNEPMTLGEALDLAVQNAPLWLPGVARGATKGAQRVGRALKEQAATLKGERGALGFPPEPGTPTTPVEGPRPLNLERIDAPDAVKGIMQRLDELVNAGEPLKGHRERQSHAETLALAKQRGLNLERMMKQDPTTFLPDEAKQTALRDAHNAAAQVLDDLERRMAAGDPVARAEYTAAFGVAMKLGELDVAAGTNLARGLESRTIASKAERAQLQGMADLAAKIKNISGVAPEELAAMRAHLNAAQQMTWMQALGASAAVTRDVLHTLWVQSLLTNPVTHTVNPFGTFAGLAWDAVAERPMAELVNRWLTRDPTGIAAGEALQAVSHPIEAMKDAVRLLGETWKTGQSPFERDTRTQGIGARLGLTGPAAEIGEATTAGKAGVPRINAEKYGWSPETLPGAFIDALGAGLDNPLLPTGWLRLEDAVPKGVAYRMEIGAQSVWQATAEMRAAEAAGTPMTPEQFAARVKDLQRTPTPAMVKAAGDHAVQITMNADLGPVGQLVTQLANTAPFGRWLVPFIRWGGNAFSFAAQRLPVTGEISALVGKNRADIAAGGRLRDQAIARMIVGHGVALLIHQEVYSGNLTGSGALTQKMAGERPFRECPSYSMKIGGDCMPANYLRTLGQVGLLIAAVADHAELSREIPDQRWYDEWAAQASAIAMALGYTFVQQSAMQGLANVLEAIKDPVRKGNAIGLGFARSAIPAGVRQLTRVRDDNVIREVHSMTDALRSGLPWTVDGVAPKRHPITGAVRHMPAGYGWDLVSPVFWQNANTDPVDAAIVANDIGQGFVLPSSIGGSNNPGDIPRMTEPLPGEGVRLTPLERDRWIDHMTEDTVHGLTLHETLMETIQSERYKAGAPGPGGMRAFLITKEVQAFRKAGLVALLKDPRHPDLEARYEAAIRTKANALRPQADPRNPLNPQRNTLNPAQLLQSLGR